MKVSLLGPLLTDGLGDLAVPSAAKPRQMLALLALNSPSVVAVGSIIEELWAEDPPPSARTTLQTYVLQLRRLLRDSAPEAARDPKRVLVTRPGGYQLLLGPGGLDIDEFESWRQRGVVAFGLGDYREAAAHMRRALDVWRGPALVDIDPGPLLRVEVARLEENRMSARAILIDSMLQLGQHAQVTGELLALNLQHPMREDICAQLMIALYRSGRRGQALDAYRRLHRALTDEMGLEPALQLRGLHESILREDSSISLGGALATFDLAARSAK